MSADAAIAQQASRRLSRISATLWDMRQTTKNPEFGEILRRLAIECDLTNDSISFGTPPMYPISVNDRGKSFYPISEMQRIING